MAQLAYQELNFMQALDVLRRGGALHLAMCDGTRPYVIPLFFQLEMRGVQPVLHMVTPSKGRAVEMLRQNGLACAEIDLPGCAWVDTVLVEGDVQKGAASTEEALDLCLTAREITARRYFLQGGALAF